MDNEKILDDKSFIVSETDLKGNIRFANDDFVNYSGYSLEELIGQPHNILRHPDMPKAAFQDLWATIKSGNIWTGFVKNRTKQGDFYWVYATVYPYISRLGEKGYISCRKKAYKDEIAKYEEIYKTMRNEERGGQR